MIIGVPKESYPGEWRVALVPLAVPNLMKAGFEVVSIEPTRVYRVEDARELLSSQGIDVDAIAPLVDGKFMSGFVRARKPTPSS